jgi:hypothetical protein
MGVQGEQLQISYKQPVRLATTANVADLAAGAPNSVDGVAVAQGDRILVWKQTTASQNGVYEVATVGTGANGSWVRAGDFDNATADSIQAGLTVYLQEGATSAGFHITLVTTGAIVLDTTALTFDVRIGNLLHGNPTSTQNGLVSFTDTAGRFVQSGTAKLDGGTAVVNPGQGVAPTVGAARGSFWVLSGTPTVAQFTDDGATDYYLANIPQGRVIYVNSTSGKDAWDGKTTDTPKATLGAAVTAASSEAPSAGNKVAIVILGGGAYSAAVSMPAHTILYGPNAKYTGGITLVDDTDVVLDQLDNGTGNGVFMGVAGTASIRIRKITASNNGIWVNNTLSDLHVEVDEVSSSTADVVVNGGRMYGHIGKITGVGGGVGIKATNSTRLLVNQITGAGTGILVDGAAASDMIVNQIASTTSYTVSHASGVLNLLVSDQTGTPGTITGTANVTEAGAGGGGSGDVVGPAAATDNAVARFDLGTGKLIQNSGVLVSDANLVSGAQGYQGAEQASAPATPAGNGTLWVRNDVPSAPVFTDDTAVDHNLLAWSPTKRPCRLATTTNVVLTAGSSPSAVDGLTTAQGDRILVWNQTTASQNGIYEVTTQGAGDTSTWARTADFDDGAKDHLEAGITVYIQEGSSYSRTTFTLVTTGTITVGTTSLEFIAMGGLARTDASSTEVIAAGTAFTAGTFVWSSQVAMRDHSDLAVYFNPQTLGSNTSVDIVVAWSDDGSTIPLADGDNYQITDFNITGFSDGSFNPKPYTARLTTAGSELVAGNMVHLTVPKGGGVCRVGVKGNAAGGTFQVRTQRLVR